MKESEIVAHAPPPIRVSIVEDDLGVRQGLRRLFKQADEFQFLSDYETGESALENIPQEKPDVVVMDISLPGMDGVECVRRLKAQSPSTQVLMLTVYEDTDRVFSAIQAGASGYMLKRTTPQELLKAVRDLSTGGAPMTSLIARKVVDAFRTPVSATTQAEGVEDLSNRERDVLMMLAKGYLVKEIAEHLGLGYGTVRTYIRRTYEKLHVRSRAQAVAKYTHFPGVACGR